MDSRALWDYERGQRPLTSRWCSPGTWQDQALATFHQEDTITTAEPSRFTVPSMAGKELEAQGQSETAPQVPQWAQRPSSLTPWTAGYGSWGRTPSPSGAQLPAAPLTCSPPQEQRTQTLSFPLEFQRKKSQQGPCRAQCTDGGVWGRKCDSVARAPRLSGWPLCHPWV